MTRVSKRILNKSIEVRMFEVFWQSFADLKSSKEVFEFLDDLLTPAEKTMLAKRLAIALLLEKGWAPLEISSVLKVSTATVNTIRCQLLWRGAGYKKVVAKILTGESINVFLENLAVGAATVISPVGKIGLAAGLRNVARTHRQEQHRKRNIL